MSTRAALAVLTGTSAVGGCATDARPERPRITVDPRTVLEALLQGGPTPVGVSRDGARVLLESPSRVGFDLTVVDRASRRPVVVYRSRSKLRTPTWSPDGRRIAFIADSGGTRRFLHVWDLATDSFVRAEAPPTTIVTAPKWSPDGTRLAYMAQPQRNVRALYVLDSAGGALGGPTVQGVAPNAGMAWSPDGSRLVTVREGGVPVVVGGPTERRLPGAPDVEIRHLAWSPAGRSLLVTARRTGDAFIGLAEIDVRTGRRRSVAAASGNMYTPTYLPSGRGLLYRLDAEGKTRIFACGRGGTDCRMLGGETAGDFPLLGITPPGDSVFLVRSGPTRPPVLHAVSVATGRGVVAYEMPRHTDADAAGGWVSIPTADGLQLPAYVWRARRVPGRRPAVLIQVPGGPGGQAIPLWDAGTQHLLDAGVDVILLNYRGQSGFGAAFKNAPGGDSARVADVLAARDYAVRSLGVTHERVFLYGHSYGAQLVTAAAESDPRVGPVVLASMTPGGWRPSPTLRARRCAVAFHGENDEKTPPAVARTVLERRLGPGATRGPCGSFRILMGEGHIFYRPDSWAAVYAAVLTLVMRTP